MSRRSQATKNKHQKNTRVDFGQYLYNQDEPKTKATRHSSMELETELLDSNYLMRREINHIAKRIKDRYN